MDTYIVRRMLSVGALALAVALVAVALATAVRAAPSTQAATAVQIQDFAFNPNSLTVPVGSTVTWTNQDQAPHTATARDGSFDTDILNLGESGSVTLNMEGTFEYFCRIHPSMVGTVIVSGSSGTGQAGGGTTGEGTTGGTTGEGTTGGTTGEGTTGTDTIKQTMPQTGAASILSLIALSAAGLIGSGLALRRRS